MWEYDELSKMITSGKVPFPMLSDGGGKVGEMYGVYDENSGVDIRGRFLIDPDGVIVGYEVLMRSPAVAIPTARAIRLIMTAIMMA
jgi:peroxiredoxin (alkyl hydroperoxide reductase subunit C)